MIKILFLIVFSLRSGVASEGCSSMAVEDEENFEPKTIIITSPSSDEAWRNEAPPSFVNLETVVRLKDRERSTIPFIRTRVSGTGLVFETRDRLTKQMVFYADVAFGPLDPGSGCVGVSSGVTLRYLVHPSQHHKPIEDNYPFKILQLGNRVHTRNDERKDRYENDMKNFIYEWPLEEVHDLNSLKILISSMKKKDNFDHYDILADKGMNCTVFCLRLLEKAGIGVSVNNDYIKYYVDQLFHDQQKSDLRKVSTLSGAGLGAGFGMAIAGTALLLTGPVGWTIGAMSLLAAGTVGGGAAVGIGMGEVTTQVINRWGPPTLEKVIYALSQNASSHNPKMVNVWREPHLVSDESLLWVNYTKEIFIRNKMILPDNLSSVYYKLVHGD